MRRLEINGTEVEIDEKTAIGITFKSYNVEKVGTTTTSDSNTFSVPITSRNLAIFGNIQDPQSLSTKVYEENLCNYWVGNEQHLTNAKISVKSITNRINLYAVNKLSFWDEAKVLLWTDFIYDLFQWLHLEKNLPSEESPFVGSFSEFITGTGVTNNTEGVLLPLYVTNLEIENKAPYNEILLNDYENTTGGHFCIYAKTIFEYIEYRFGLNFGVSEVGLNGNLWDDIIATSLFIPVRELLVISIPDGSEHYFKQPESTLWATEFPPYDLNHANEDKTLLEFISAFFQHLNVLKDEILINGKSVVRLSRFDDLEDKAEVVDYSDNFDFIKSFTPTIKGYGQENYIKFESIYENGSKFTNSKKLTSLNKNIDVKKDLFTIDAYIGNVLESNPSDVLIDLSTEDSFKTFEFLISGGLTSDLITVLSKQDSISNPAVFSPFINISFSDFVSSSDGSDVFGVAADNNNIAICQNRLLNIGATSFIKLKWDVIEGGGDFSMKIFDGISLLKTVPISAEELEFQFTSAEGILPVLLTIEQNVLSITDKTLDIRNVSGFIYNKNPFETTSLKLKKAAFYDLNSEYNLLNSALQYPRFYEVQRWMTNEDIRKLEFFKLYYFRQLGGSFFINSVKGFNPDKSKKSTTLEVFKVSDRTPPPVYDREFLVDDSGNYFVDDSGNKFY